MLLNRPELVAAWIGMGKIGAATALLNTNSTGKALVHTVEVATKDSEVKILIIDADLRDQVAEDIPALESLGIRVIFWDALLQTKLDSLSSSRPNRQLRSGVLERDALMYIFTSGTTGALVFHLYLFMCMKASHFASFYFSTKRHPFNRFYS